MLWAVVSIASLCTCCCVLQEKETTPTFGFSNATTDTKSIGIGGRLATLEVYDLGGGTRIRKLWNNYLADVHGVVYVVDAADKERFAECRQVLTETLNDRHLVDKPILVFANKQDLPSAATAAEVAQQLGLSELKRNAFQILPCTAKTLPGKQADPRLKEGVKWLVSAIDSVFGKLDQRVQAEAEVVRQEEAKKKKERAERARLQKEERMRQKAAEEAAEAAAAAAEAGMSGSPQQPNVLSGLPGCIDSPKPGNAPGAGASATVTARVSAQGGISQFKAAPEFSDLLQSRRLSAGPSPNNSLRVIAPPIPTVAELESPLPANLPALLPTNLPIPQFKLPVQEEGKATPATTGNGDTGSYLSSDGGVGGQSGKGSFRGSRVVPEP